MFVSRSPRCLFLIDPLPKARTRLRIRRFHNSPNLPDRRRPRFASLKYDDMQTAKGRDRLSKPAEELFPAYNEKHMAKLRKRYTPEQIASLEAAEAAISPEDLKVQARMRRDTHQLRYIDDFAVTLPMLDREPEKPWEIAPPGTDWQEEHNRDFEKGFAEKLEDMRAAAEAEVAKKKGKLELTPEESAEAFKPISRLEHFKLMDGLVGPSAMAPGTFDYEGQDERKKEREKSEEQKQAEEMKEKLDPGGKMEKAAKEVGLDERAMKNLKQKVLLNKNVTNVTPLGKVVSTFVMYMVGTGNGRLGIGQAKGLDANETLRQAKLRAIRGLRPIPRYEERTIFGDVETKIAATVVKLSARPPGFGLRCQHFIYEIARAAGIHDLAARVPRSRNPMNTIKATYQALMSQRLPEEVAQGRGRKLVDVRKVYYAGRV